jgi:phage replication O-like protein O
MTEDKNNKFKGFRSPKYTQVPDEVFDELMSLLSGAELKVLLYVCRRTFGFKKESDTISLNQIGNGIRTKDGRILDRGTGLSKDSVSRAVKRLEELGVIVRGRIRSAEKGDQPTTYSLNMLPVSENLTPPTIKIGQGGTRKSDTQETVLQQTDIQDNVNVTVVPKTSKNPADPPTDREDYILTELATALNDRDPRSRNTYRRIIQTLGEETAWRILGLTKEAHQSGLIKSRRAPYFVGIAKQVAAERGLDLGFASQNHNGHEQSPVDFASLINSISNKIGNTDTIQRYRAKPDE